MARKPLRFECSVYTIPPLRRMPKLGLEPRSQKTAGLKSAVFANFTTSAYTDEETRTLTTVRPLVSKTSMSTNSITSA